MRTSFLAVAILLASLAACGGGGGSGGNPTPGTARSYMRTDSAVTVVPGGAGGSNRYTATQTITISNDSGGATSAVVHLSDDAGSVSSSAGSTGYQIQVTLSAEGGSDAQARAALGTMRVAHRDALDPGVLYLDNAVEFAQYNVSNSNRTATVAATLPATLSYRLGQAVGAGATSSSGLAGPAAQLSSGAGTVTLSGNWLRSTADSGAGAVDVTVTQTAGAGYDLIADTGAGTASIAVAGTVPNGSQSPTHAHFTSTNYASSNPKVSVAASSGAGSASIHD